MERNTALIPYENLLEISPHRREYLSPTQPVTTVHGAADSIQASSDDLVLE
jgi:hypothetical protein